MCYWFISIKTNNKDISNEISIVDLMFVETYSTRSTVILYFPGDNKRKKSPSDNLLHYVQSHVHE